MSKIGIIGKAWIEVLKGTTTELHKKRAEVCGTCVFAKHRKYLEFQDELIEVKGMVCSACGCPLVAKVRSEDNCEKGFWDSIK